jgi:hypothetical protein
VPPELPTDPNAAELTALGDARNEATRLVELAGTIERALVQLDAASSPRDARLTALTAETDLLRLGIAAVNLRAKLATLANYAHVAELAQAVGEVRK